LFSSNSLALTISTLAEFKSLDLNLAVALLYKALTFRGLSFKTKVAYLIASEKFS